MDKQEIKNRIDNLSSEIVKLKRLLNEQSYKIVLDNDGEFVVKKNKDCKEGTNIFSSKEVAEQVKEKLNFVLQLYKNANMIYSDENTNNNREHVPIAIGKTT